MSITGFKTIGSHFVLWRVREGVVMFDYKYFRGADCWTITIFSFYNSNSIVISNFGSINYWVNVGTKSWVFYAL